MNEQFGAIPVRAFADARLSAADFRVMGAIAYFDRLGRNGTGCYADPRKLAELAAVDYKHVARHTGRLREFGYLEIVRSATDRRKRVYSLNYKENRSVIANSGDNLVAGAKGAEAAPFNEQNVTSNGDKPQEKITKSNSQALDPQEIPALKRLSEAYLKNPAKRIARVGDITARGDKRKPSDFARQGNQGGVNGRAQVHMMQPIQGGNQKPETRSRGPDWYGWARWLQQHLVMSCQAAWQWLLDEQDRIATERRIDLTAAGAILDRELKKRRARLRDELQDKIVAPDRVEPTHMGNAELPGSPVSTKHSAPAPLSHLHRRSQRPRVTQPWRWRGSSWATTECIRCASAARACCCSLERNRRLWYWLLFGP